MSQLDLIQVVRRYGPVGGMERYVWELSLELQQLGHRVSVICERCHVEKPKGITVYELGEITSRPRWLSLLRFSRHVAQFLADHPCPKSVIHSHERLNIHHVTTFHGPPFATVLDKPWWRLISLRIAMQLFLEQRELATPRYVVPNSRFISQSLAHYYPEMAHKLIEPIIPGVVPGALRELRQVPPDGGIVGFVGKEWQRKGLPWAVEIVAALRRTRPNLQLHVVGPSPDDVTHLFAGWHGGYKLMGWSDHAHYVAFDVLLHPARAEPYGMVISEAIAAKVPVLVSDVCGAAAHVTAASGAVLPLSVPLDIWVGALDHQLSRSAPVPQFERSWGTVAAEYVLLYSRILPNGGGDRP